MDCDSSACSENYKMEDVSLVTPFPPLQGRGLSVLSVKQIHTSALNDGTNQRCDIGKAFISFPSELTLVIFVHQSYERPI